MEVKQTIFIFDQVGEDAIKFFVLKGDYTRFDGVYINHCEDERGEEIGNLIYDEDGNYKVKLLKSFPYRVFGKYSVEEVRVITVGFAP